MCCKFKLTVAKKKGVLILRDHIRITAIYWLILLLKRARLVTCSASNSPQPGTSSEIDGCLRICQNDSLHMYIILHICIFIAMTLKLIMQGEQ